MAMKKLKYFNSGKEIHVAKIQENDWNFYWTCLNKSMCICQYYRGQSRKFIAKCLLDWPMSWMADVRASAYSIVVLSRIQRDMRGTSQWRGCTTEVLLLVYCVMI